MSRRRKRVDELATSAIETAAEDGTDPRRDFDRRTWGEARSPAGRKARQLCEQVHRALTVIFPGLADDVLQSLLVVSVEPAPHSGRLLVTVAGPTPTDATDPPPVAEHLVRAVGRLRSEVAATVHRRKAPELVFRVRW